MSTDLHKQMDLVIQRFDTAIRSMAFNAAHNIYQEERKRLIRELSSLSTPRPTRTTSRNISQTARIKAIENSSGKWTRDGKAFYVVLGPYLYEVPEPESYVLQRVDSDKLLFVIRSTLLSRWKNVP